ncbi:MAG: hypothetical protein AAGF24_03260 [Cyanobacteria bacterium P01_H01_bin.121]
MSETYQQLVQEAADCAAQDLERLLNNIDIPSERVAAIIQGDKLSESESAAIAEDAKLTLNSERLTPAYLLERRLLRNGISSERIPLIIQGTTPVKAELPAIAEAFRNALKRDSITIRYVKKLWEAA